jgi:hypothetical protein
MGLSAPGWLVRGRPSWGSAILRGLFGKGLWAHSVRRESCNSDSSPEPSAAGWEGLVGRARSWGSALTGACSEGGLQACSARRESCNADSSPEPAAAGWEGLVARTPGWGSALPGACSEGASGEISGGTPLPLWGLFGEGDGAPFQGLVGLVMGYLGRCPRLVWSCAVGA